MFVHDVGPNAFGCVRTLLVRERVGAEQRAPTPKTKRRSYQRGGGSRHQGGGPENTGGVSGSMWRVFVFFERWSFLYEGPHFWGVTVSRCAANSALNMFLCMLFHLFSCY